MNTKNDAPTAFCARRSLVSDRVLEPVNRHTTITDAAPSTALPIAQETTPIELACAPAINPTAPSSVIQSRLAHASLRAIRAARCHAVPPARSATETAGSAGIARA